MAEENKIIVRSIYFDLPRRKIISYGNIYTGSENTFNYRFKADKDTKRIHLWVWYGVKCFELSEPVTEHEEDDSDEGYAALANALDYDYDAYKEKLKSGEVTGRHTYEDRTRSGPVMSEYEIFAEDDSEDRIKGF